MLWFLYTEMALLIKKISTLRPIQNGRHFPDDIFKCIFLFENVLIWIKISLKCVAKVRINNIPAVVLIMAWRWIGDKPLSEPMMVNLLTHICVTRPQWVIRRRWWLVYPAQSIAWLLMSWRRKKPGHQQLWYLFTYPGILQFYVPTGFGIYWASIITLNTIPLIKLYTQIS